MLIKKKQFPLLTLNNKIKWIVKNYKMDSQKLFALVKNKREVSEEKIYHQPYRGWGQPMHT